MKENKRKHGVKEIGIGSEYYSILTYTYTHSV